MVIRQIDILSHAWKRFVRADSLQSRDGVDLVYGSKRVCREQSRASRISTPTTAQFHTSRAGAVLCSTVVSLSTYNRTCRI